MLEKSEHSLQQIEIFFFSCFILSLQYKEADYLYIDCWFIW